MTLKKGPFRVYCDEPDCGEYEDLGTDDFDEACDAVKDAGYEKSVSPRRGFQHFCPAHSH